jgi:Ca2+-binding EF-hand superfamily protein
VPLHFDGPGKSAFPLPTLREIFISIDTNGDGVLDPAEIRDALKKTIQGPDTSEVKKCDLQNMISKLDDQGNGTVDYASFLGFIVRETV